MNRAWLLALLLLPLASAHWHFDSANVQSPYTGDGVVIAVLDGGVESEVLADQLWVNDAETINGLDDDQNGWTDDVHGWDTCEDQPYDRTDFDGHGTAVAGAAAGPIGVAPDATVMVVRVRCHGDVYPSVNGPLDLEGLREGIEYATVNGANVIVMSLQNWPDHGHGQVAALLQLEDEFQAAEQAGILLVAATGNAARTSASSPANHPLVFAVGALNACDGAATYSNGGANIWAPGEVRTLGLDGYETWNGTSFAAPMVAGAAALLLEERVRSPEELRGALLGFTARDKNVLDVGGLFGSPRELPAGTLSYRGPYTIGAEHSIQFHGSGGLGLEMVYSQAGTFCVPVARTHEPFWVLGDTFRNPISVQARLYPGEWIAFELINSDVTDPPDRPLLVETFETQGVDVSLPIVVLLSALLVSLTLRKRK